MTFNKQKTRVNYEKITLEIMKVIIKECRDIRPEELLTLSGSFMTTLILSTVDTLDALNITKGQKNVRIDKTKAALNLTDTITATVKDTIRYMHDTEKLV